MLVGRLDVLDAVQHGVDAALERVRALGVHGRRVPRVARRDRVAVGVRRRLAPQREREHVLAVRRPQAVARRVGRVRRRRRGREAEPRRAHPRAVVQRVEVHAEVAERRGAALAGPPRGDDGQPREARLREGLAVLDERRAGDDLEAHGPRRPREVRARRRARAQVAAAGPGHADDAAVVPDDDARRAGREHDADGGGVGHDARVVDERRRAERRFE